MLIVFPTFAQPTLPIITPDNIHQLQQQHVFGRGYRYSPMIYTPDGENLLVRARLGLWQYDAQDLSIETQRDTTGWFLGYYLDGRYMLFKQDPNTIQIFDGETETLLYEVAFGDENYQFNGFSADGQHLFTSYYNRETRESRSEIWELERDSIISTIQSINFSGTELTPEDKRVIIEAPYDDHTYMVWDRTTHTLSSSLDGTERFLAYGIKFNLDGTRYMLSSDYNVYLYDASTETLIQELTPFELDHLNYISGFLDYAFTPDSQYILGTGYDHNCYCAGYGAFIFDGLTGDYIQDITRPNRFGKITFSPTGEYVILHSSPQSIVRRIGTWEEVFTTEDIELFHPQNDQILYYEDNRYKTVNLDTGEIIDIGNFNAPFAVAYYLSSFMFSPKDTYIASESGDSVFLWDVQTKALVRKFLAQGYIDGIQYLFFSDDEKFLIATLTEGTVYIWDIQENRLVHTISNQSCRTVSIEEGDEYEGMSYCRRPSDLVDMEVHQMFLEVGVSQHPTISPDNRYFAIAFDNHVSIYDMETGVEYYEIQVPDTYGLDGLWFTSDSRFIFAISIDGTITKWDIENQVQVHDSDMYMPDDIQGQIILDDQFFIIKETQIYFLDKETGKVSRIFDTIHQDRISKARLSGNGKVFFTHEQDGLSLLWDLETGTYTHLSNQFEVNWDWDNPVRFNFDGSILTATCIVDENERICLYDGKTGEFLETIDAPVDDTSYFEFDEYITVVFNQSGTQMAVNKRDGTIRLWGIGD
jgi:WD40 repeat protein